MVFSHPIDLIATSVCFVPLRQGDNPAAMAHAVQARSQTK